MAKLIYLTQRRKERQNKMKNVKILPLYSPSGGEARYGPKAAGSVRSLTLYTGVRFPRLKTGSSTNFIMVI